MAISLLPRVQEGKGSITFELIVTARLFIVGFEPRFLCSVVNTSITLFAYYLCVARLSLFVR